MVRDTTEEGTVRAVLSSSLFYLLIFPCHLRRVTLVLAAFLIAVNKRLIRNSFREERFILTHSKTGCSSSWQGRQGHVSVRKLNTGVDQRESIICAQLTFSFLTQCATSPQWWCCPHSGWGWILQRNLSGNIFTDISSDVFPWWFCLKISQHSKFYLKN